MFIPTDEEFHDAGFHKSNGFWGRHAVGLERISIQFTSWNEWVIYTTNGSIATFNRLQIESMDDITTLIRVFNQK